jgi:hypothetical protein
LAEEQEPTPPHSEAQAEWIAAHKEDPEAAINKQLQKLRSRDIPTPLRPKAYIDQQLEIAKMVGAKVAHFPGWSATWLDMPNEHVCSCARCDFRVRPAKEPSSPHHYSTAWGDAVLQVAKLEGDEWKLIADAVEVDVDEDYAIRVSMPAHECGNCLRRSGGGGGVCLYRDRGEFGVRLEVQRLA